MRFFRARREPRGRWWLALVLPVAGCASWSRGGPKDPRHAGDLASTDTVAVLEQRELEQPESAEIKLALARGYWCRGDRGLAIEHWLWLLQFSAESEEGSRARAAMEKVEQGREAEIAALIRCL